jgi:hypothetical protein
MKPKQKRATWARLTMQPRPDRIAASNSDGVTTTASAYLLIPKLIDYGVSSNPDRFSYLSENEAKRTMRIRTGRSRV